MSGFSEAQWEELALEALAEHGWKPLKGIEIAPGTDERQSWDDIVLPGRLAELVSPKSQDTIAENYRMHQAIVDGYRGVSYLDPTASSTTGRSDWSATSPARTTGWRSAKSRSEVASTTAGSTSWSTSTACRWRSSERRASGQPVPEDVKRMLDNLVATSTVSGDIAEDELAFYDAVSTNESAVELQGEDVLAQIARELVEVMRRDVKTDWTVRDDVRAKLRSSIKRLLVKHKYPPDKQQAAIQLVFEQMEAMAPRYAA